MSDFKRPGVYLSETLAAPQAGVGVSVSSGCFVGTSPRGPLGATLVTSYPQFVRLYGGLTPGQPASDLAYAVYQFFNNGGRQCYIVRVTDGTDVAATVDLLDQEPTGTDPTTPRATLTVTASNPGAWGNGLGVTIIPSPLDATRFTLTVFFGGASGSNIVERFYDLSMDPTDGRYVESVVNSPDTGSIYVQVTDAGLHAEDAVSFALATPATTGTVDNPTVTALTTGADGGVPNTAAWTAAVALVDSVTDPVNLNLPGITSTSIVNAALAYAEARGDVFVVIDGITASGGTPPTVAGAVTAAQAYTASSYGAVYFPRPVIADPASNSPGATKIVAPGGAVLGQIASVDAGEGVQKTPAGLNTRIANAVGLEIALSNSDLDTLNTSQVNAIRNIPGAGVVIMGGRTLTRTGKADKYVSVRRTLIYVKAQLALLTRFAVFEPNFYLTWQQVQNVVEQFLLGFWQSGGLTGDDATQAFYVICDDTNNTAQTVAAGELHIDIGVAPQKPAEFIAINISQFDGTVSVAEAA